MNKTELIKMASAKSGMPQSEIYEALTAILGTIEAELWAGQSVSLVGFGTFSVKERPARKGHNPATGEKIEIPAKKSVRFSASKKAFDFAK